MRTSDTFQDDHLREFGAWIGSIQENIRPRPSDRQVARAAGISATHYGHIKKGATGAKKDTVVKIAIALGIDPQVACKRAFTFTSDPDETEIRLAQRLGPILKSLSPDRRAKAEDALAQMAELLVYNAA